MGYKMVFSDMDGTLLWKGVRVSVENSAAIRKAVDKGVEFVICTGRGVFGVEKHLQELHLLGKKGYVICQNGAAVYDLRDMHLVLKSSFSPSVVQPIAERARALGLELFYYDDRNFMIEKLTDEVKSYCWMMQANPRILQELTDYAKNLSALKRYVEKTAGDIFDLFYSSETYLELVKKGVSKGNALAATAQEANVPLAETIAIGDSDNDLSMILQAGLGVAMKNGEAHVKAAADYITERSCEENGVAEVIEKFILK